MHDGLGSSLLSAMVAVEQGSMPQDQVVTVLRECVDDLRLVIDSLEPVGHDIVSLLATMRYRLGKRLRSAASSWNGTCTTCRRWSGWNRPTRCTCCA